MNPSSKIALIVGGTRMGLAIAQTLGDAGYTIILTWNRSRKAVEDSCLALMAKGIAAISLPCDLSRPRSIESMIKKIQIKFGRLDAVINLASIYEKGELGDEEVWDRHFTVNVRSGYLLISAAVPLMRIHGGGHVVTISDWTSASARPRYKNYSAYYSSKAAIKALTESLALELAPENILVNSIAPGPIIAPPDLSKKEIQDVCRATPLGRWGGPEEIAKAVLFLVQTQFMTGETLRVDGGRHLN